MSLLKETEIKQLEKKYSEGVKSALVVDTFKSRGERFSEPTLRKYVQLGLLPKSRRVGAAGRHRGSSGLYPVSIVRQINAIKKALSKGSTLEEIRLGKIGLGGEIDSLQRHVTQAIAVFAEAVDKCDDRAQKSKLKKALAAHKKSVEQGVKELRKLASSFKG